MTERERERERERGYNQSQSDRNMDVPQVRNVLFLVRKKKTNDKRSPRQLTRYTRDEIQSENFVVLFFAVASLLSLFSASICHVHDTNSK